MLTRLRTILKTQPVCMECRRRVPSGLFVLGLTCFQLCTLLACMFHWHRAQQWLINNTFGTWEFWRAIGFLIPAGAMAASILLIEAICRWRAGKAEKC